MYLKENVDIVRFLTAVKKCSKDFSTRRRLSVSKQMQKACRDFGQNECMRTAEEYDGKYIYFMGTGVFSKTSLKA